MNSCEYYQELMSRLVDGDLSEEGRAVLAEHLKNCNECSAVYDAFAGISQAISDDLLEPPEGFAENVMAQIRRNNITVNGAKPLGKNKKEKKKKAADKKASETKSKGMPKPVKILLSTAACLAVVASAAFAVTSLTGKSLFGENDSVVFGAAAEEETMPRLGEGGSDIDGFAAMPPEPRTAKAESTEEDKAAEAAPASDSNAMLQTAPDTESASVSNVYKIDILYNDDLISDFTMRVGEAPIPLGATIYPISIKESPRWSSSDEKVIKVDTLDDGRCSVNAVGGGTATVIAEYSGFKAECWVHVVDESGSSDGLEIQYVGTKIYEFTMHVGDPNIPLKAELDTDLASGDIIWSSSDENVIMVHDSEDGYCAVEAVSPGSASVILQVGDQQCKCKVYVTEMPENS